jgi:hypothetical protein
MAGGQELQDAMAGNEAGTTRYQNSTHTSISHGASAR